MHDCTRLARLLHVDAKGKSHKLHNLFTAENGKFCISGTLMPLHVRKVYMMAGIISPSDDNIEEWFQSIKKNIVFLNNYLDYSQPRSEPPVSPIQSLLPLRSQMSTEEPKKKPRRNRKSNKSAKDF
jgi:hypothetical protein